MTLDKTPRGKTNLEYVFIYEESRRRVTVNTIYERT
jgi:hypothetical protein